MAAIGSRPIRAHHSSHVHASFLCGIELCCIRCKKRVQEKSCTRNHVRRSSFLYKSTCTSFSYKFLDCVTTITTSPITSQSKFSFSSNNTTCTVYNTGDQTSDRLRVQLSIVMLFILFESVQRAVNSKPARLCRVVRCHHGQQGKCLHCVPYEVGHHLFT